MPQNKSDGNAHLSFVYLPHLLHFPRNQQPIHFTQHLHHLSLQPRDRLNNSHDRGHIYPIQNPFPSQFPLHIPITTLLTEQLGIPLANQRAKLAPII